MKFKITERLGNGLTGREFVTSSDSIESAARRAAVRLYGHAKTIMALRVTGEAQHAGIFQSYVPVPQSLGGGLNSIGYNFLVRENYGIAARNLSRAAAPHTKSSAGGIVKLGRCLEIRYQRTMGRKPGLYKHVFTKHVSIYTMPDGSTVIR